MLLICKNLLVNGSADFIGEKRFIYEGGNPEGKKIEAQKGTEKKEVTSEDVDKAKENFLKEKAALEKKLDEYAKSDNPAIKQAAETAKADLKRFGESSSFTPEAIQSHLNYIQLTINYFTLKPKIDGNVKQIEDRSKALTTEWTDFMKNATKDYAPKYPFLPPDVLAQISALGADYTERSEGGIAVIALSGTMDRGSGQSDKDLSLEDYLMNPDQTTAMAARHKSTLEMLKGSDQGSVLWADLQRIGEEMQTRCDALVNIEAGKDIKRSVDMVNTTREDGFKNLDDWGKTYNQDVSDRKGLLDAACKNALAALQIMVKPEDAPKRALILATLDDQSKKIFNVSGEMNPNGMSSVNAVLGFTKTPKDKYFAGFEKGKTVPADASLKLDEKVKKTDEYFSLSGNPNFRLEGSGAKMAVLDPNTVVQVVDANIMQIETSDGGKVNYIKVRLNPPEGPIGYVAQNHVNFQKKILGADEKTPEIKPQQTA